MGIKGAWTLISNEPNRFGEVILLSSDQPTHSTIFLDGPALLYHVNVNECYDVYPPSSAVRLCQTPVSPDIIYTRTTNLLKALCSMMVSCERLHVVMDGLAPTNKIPTQIHRLKQIAIECDERATQTKKSKHNIVHLLAEWAMEEAVRDVPGVQLHRPTFGEAEPYINQFIEQRRLKQVLILSGDSDFFVYPNCPGFVPFRGLEWNHEDVIASLTAFHYLSSKFWKAHVPYDPLVATTVAALAGCDYGTPLLHEARAKIVASDIAGLRPKQRTTPSNAAALTAVLRYVGVYVKHNSQHEWMTPLLASLGMEEAADSLNNLHAIYFPDKIDVQSTNDKTTSLLPELQRVVDFGIFYCRPMVESCGRNVSAKQTVLPQTRNRSRKSGKGKRKKRTSSVISQAGLEPEDPDPPSEEDPVQLPLFDAEVEAYIESDSVWRFPPFKQMRSRLYSLLLRGTNKSAVQEYSRHGKGFGVEYIALLVSVIIMDASWEAMSEIQAIGYIVGLDSPSSLKEALDCIPSQHKGAYLASLVLAPTSALMLLLLATCPASSAGMPDPKQPPKKKSKQSLHNMLNLVSAAYYQVHLTCNAVGREDLLPPQLNQFFSWTISWWIFNCLDDEIDNLYFSALDCVFVRLDEKFPESTGECSSRVEWKKDVGHLWRQWLICHDLLFK